MKKPHAVRLFFGFLSSQLVLVTTRLRTAQTPRTASPSDATRNLRLYVRSQ
jgi:hypothetical protein